MNYFQIESQAELDRLIASVNWNEAVIREMHVVSESYSVRQDDGRTGTYAHGALPTLRCFITAVQSEIPAFELRFIEVSRIDLRFDQDLAPAATWNHDITHWSFEDSANAIAARRLSYLVLDESVWGEQLLFGTGLQ